MMKYREQLLKLMTDNTGEAMIAWVSKQPLLDQPEILREFREMLSELDHDKNAADLLAELDATIEKYEDKILDQKLMEAQLQMILEDKEKVRQRIEGKSEGFRDYVIECILLDAPNANEMKEMAETMMEFEKKTGTYDVMNWWRIL